MAVLIDPPRWPAHGTVFSHLVSDSSLAELHALARAAGLPTRAFDHDHYDVPQRRYADLVALGAVEVSATELVRRLVASGLRLRTPHRTPKRADVLPGLVRAWRALLPDHDELGADLVDRWSEPHRHYHDVRHLAHCLDALSRLGEAGEVGRPVWLAAWFHDAVYAGRPGDDEEASALLAEDALVGLVADDERAEVARLVRVTATHAPAPGDVAAAQLVDADLSVLASSPGRYHVYLRDVRLEYGHVDDTAFASGRRRVVERLLALDPLFSTAFGRAAWEPDARANLRAELDSDGWPA